MSENIKSIFEDECKDLEIDTHLAKRISKYNNAFISKNSEHIEFFGSNLTGAHVVRFVGSDRDRWFDDVLEVNDGPLEERLHALPTVNADWNISSDTMNLSCAWLLHAIFISKKLTDAQKHEAMIDVVLVLQYKYLTSILFHWFRFPTDKATAEATYAQLTYKYGLKVHGSWMKLLKSRAEEIISKESIHYNCIRKMDVDDDVTYLLNDSQGRIRDIIKNIYVVFDRVHKQGLRISSTSSVVIEHDGAEILKDKTKSALTYSHYINSIVSDKNSFIRSELTSIIEKLVHTMPPNLFLESLQWMSNNYRQSGAGVVEEVLNITLIHALDYLSHNRELIKNSNDIAGLLGKLKGVYMSSRSTDVELYELRNKTEIIVKNATNNKNDSVISSVRTGILLYIVLRAMTMRHYSNI
ncbi:MAG: hypothetical protein ACD_84C00031G0003 [uncultured bacterium]|nr:MAG: hypothetical protein ACD_84C00031G0003 [uncultured bacterium]